MRKAAALLAAVSLAFAAPAHAEPSSSFSQAISNTLYEYAKRQGATDQEAADFVSAASSKVSAIKSGAKSWLEWIASLGWEWPFDIFSGTRGGSFGGGGATGSWGPPELAPSCEQMNFELTPSGRPRVPTIRLAPGMQFQRAGDSTSGDQTYRRQSGDSYHVARPLTASILWYYHRLNLGRGTDERNWWGVWAIEKVNNVSQWRVSRSTGDYFDMLGGFVSYSNSEAVFASHSFQWIKRNLGSGAGTSVNCPEGEAVGGNVHFYGYGSAVNQITTCTMYYPNESLGVGGYAYPHKTPIAWDDVDQYLKSNIEWSSCDVASDLLQRVADHIKNETPAPFDKSDPVSEEDVRNGGTQPRGDDLTENPTTLPTKNEESTAPPAAPTPTPTPTVTPNPDEYDHVPANTPALTAPDVNWWPELPSVSVDLGSHECPTYSFDALDQTFELTTHCDLIEQNRAIISAIMLVLFTFGSVLIVLRA